MKKSLFFAAMACIAFAGCTEDEVTTGNSNQEREICFTSPYVGKTTRTVYQEMDNPYATTENFNVFGVWHTGTFAGWSTASLYMNDAETAYDDTYNGWRANDRYYWPKNGYLTYAAYSPTTAKSASAGITYDKDGLHIVDFQVANINANHIDLMYSKRSYNKKKADTNNTNVPYDQVDIDFQHALSSIHFTAKLGAAYTGTTITLKKISIYGVYTNGDFDENVNETTPGTYTSAPAWSDQGNPLLKANEYVYFNGSKVLTDAKYVIKDETGQVDIIALPQTLPANAKIEVEYTIDSPGLATPAITQVNTVEIKNLTTTEWLPGKRYIYNMTFDFDEIYFAPEIIDWKPADETEVEIDDYE
ncbi:MAG: fimbrillin family protein [Bacteroidaceae bacterium]|nr:fimbrillin family protein [Bacteroidaceae bacterium]